MDIWLSWLESRTCGINQRVSVKTEQSLVQVQQGSRTNGIQQKPYGNVRLFFSVPFDTPFDMIRPFDKLRGVQLITSDSGCGKKVEITIGKSPARTANLR